MLRISRAETPDNEGLVVLRVEGQVTGRWVEELRLACAATLGSDGLGHNHLILDLAEVSFLDADAVALFRTLAAHRVLLRNCSLFIAAQLKEAADVDK